jgi:GxxExxY protein
MNFRDDLLYKDECYLIMGACFEVYKHQGCGFPEAFYQECLEIEFNLQAIPAVARPECQVAYKDQTLRTYFVPDFICCGKMILEIKALPGIEDRHRAQMINYLKATGHDLGLLVNFGAHPKLEWERIPRAMRLKTPAQKQVPKE